MSDFDEGVILRAHRFRAESVGYRLERGHYRAERTTARIGGTRCPLPGRSRRPPTDRDRGSARLRLRRTRQSGWPAKCAACVDARYGWRQACAGRVRGRVTVRYGQACSHCSGAERSGGRAIQTLVVRDWPRPTMWRDPTVAAAPTGRIRHPRIDTAPTLTPVRGSSQPAAGHRLTARGHRILAGESRPHDVSNVQIVQSINREESNDGTHETKPPELRRR